MINAFSNLSSVLKYFFFNHGLQWSGCRPPHGSLRWSWQPGLPSFLEHAKLIPDAGTLHTLSLCTVMVLPQTSRHLASSVFQVSSQKIISSEKSSLTPEKPSPHSNPIILLSCEFLKCSCFLVYRLSSSTGRFFESITAFLAPTTEHMINAQ